MTRVFPLSRWIALAAFCITLAGCGQHAQPRPAPAPYPVLTVYWTPSSPVLSIPVYLAESLHLFADQHLSVQWSTNPGVPVSIATPSRHWPIVGLIASRPDSILVAPSPDPHFRLRTLKHLPVVYARSESSMLPIIQHALAIEQVTPSSYTALPFSHIEQLWRKNQLPFGLVNLSQLQTLKRLDPKTTVLSWLGASTGAIPTLVVTGPPGPKLVRFLTALNLALWYLHTHRVRDVQSLIQNRLSLSSRQTDQLIRQGLYYDIWPTTIVPVPADYRRGRALMSYGPQPESWPPWEQGVNATAARQALSLSIP